MKIACSYEEHAIFIQKILVHSGALFSKLKCLQEKASKFADATGDFACLVFVLLAASARPRVVQSVTCPVRELAIRELSSYHVDSLTGAKKKISVHGSKMTSCMCDGAGGVVQTRSIS